jgi:hypothetical protein
MNLEMLEMLGSSLKRMALKNGATRNDFLIENQPNI